MDLIKRPETKLVEYSDSEALRHADSEPPAAVGREGMGVARIVVFGVVVVTLFFGGFGVWGAFAPLESAAIARGILSVDTKRKTVQHLEGGIVADILVEEGEEVVAGQDLVALDDTKARTSFSLIEAQYHSTAALQARLQAERDGLEQIRWPEWLREAASEAEIFATQERIFRARAKLLENHTGIYEHRIAQMGEEVAGFKEEIKAQNRQIELLEEEVQGISGLVEKGFEGKTRLLALKRRQAEVAGARARNRALIARVGQRIGEARLNITELANSRLNEVVEELRDAETRLSELRERLSAARHVLSRTHITAPVSGAVVNLQVFTRGGVVRPGQALMDIVPAGDELVIEAQVEPIDIDVVYVGLPAQVRLTAFSQLTTPILTGTVLQVSADSLVDERTGATYYVARVGLDMGQPGLEGLKLQPGMPAEVMIVTGARTPLDYLLKPIVTSLGRALREE